MLFNWFTHTKDHETEFLEWIERLRKIARIEAKSLKNFHLEAGMKHLEELMRMVEYEQKEGVILEKQLVYQFRMHEAKLMQKNKVMTEALGKRVAEINRLVNTELHLSLLVIEEELKAGNVKAAENQRMLLLRQLAMLEQELLLATELISVIDKWEKIPSVICTLRFIERLKTDQMRDELKKIEDVLTLMPNTDWLRHNSGQLTAVGGNLYSCPKRGGLNLRIIYSIEGSNIVVHDAMLHSEYEKRFIGGARLSTDNGRFQVFKPLAAFAQQTG